MFEQVWQIGLATAVFILLILRTSVAPVSKKTGHVGLRFVLATIGWAIEAGIYGYVLGASAWWHYLAIAATQALAVSVGIGFNEELRNDILGRQPPSSGQFQVESFLCRQQEN
jgi:hypothetical protein